MKLCRVLKAQIAGNKKAARRLLFLHRKLDLSQFFLDASCFTRQVAQVVQLGLRTSPRRFTAMLSICGL
jgi:hypothetical protein